MKKSLVFLFFFVIMQLFSFRNILDLKAESKDLNISAIKFEGLESFSAEWLIRKLDLNKISSLTSERDVLEMAYRIEDFLKSKGYYFATCDYFIEELPDNESQTLVFKVNEGQKVYVDDVSFEGNVLISGKKLKQLIKTKPSGFFSKSYLNDDVIADDKDIIENYYKKNGIKAIVTRVEKVFNENNTRAKVKFFIEEKGLYENFKDKRATNVLKKITNIQQEIEALRKKLEEKEKENRVLKQRVQEENERAEKAIKELEQVKTSAKKAVEKMEILSKKLEEKEELKEMLTGYLAQERLKTKNKENEIRKLKEEIEKLKVEKEKIKEKLAKAKEEIEKKEAEKDELKEKMMKLADMVKRKIDKIDKLNSQLAIVLDDARQAVSRELDSIELSTIVVTGGKTPKIVMKTKNGEKIELKDIATDKKTKKKYLANGKVLVVNRKLNFVVINYGENDGVKEGMKFGIYKKGEELIATIRIIETRDEISAGEILTVNEGEKIKVGNKVILLENS